MLVQLKCYFQGNPSPTDDCTTTIEKREMCFFFSYYRRKNREREALPHCELHGGRSLGSSQYFFIYSEPQLGHTVN